MPAEATPLRPGGQPSHRRTIARITTPVPLALYCWACAPRDVAAAVEHAVAGLWESPRSVAWIEALGERLARTFASPSPAREGPLPLAWPRLLLRNVAFTAIVLAHGLTRLVRR